MIKNGVIIVLIFILIKTVYSSKYMDQILNQNSKQSIKEPNKKLLANEIDPMCNIIVYTSVDCRLCDAAVEALESKRVRYCQKDINQSPQNMQTYDELRKGKVCGPIAVIGDKVIRGFSYKFSAKSYARAIDSMSSNH